MTGHQRNEGIREDTETAYMNKYDNEKLSKYTVGTLENAALKSNPESFMPAMKRAEDARSGYRRMLVVPDTGEDNFSSYIGTLIPRYVIPPSI
jgi:hypothetical protein